MPSLETIWRELQDSYRKEMNPVSYNTWIEPAKPLSFQNKQHSNELCCHCLQSAHFSFKEI